jgi:hypothetical protein
MSPFNWSVLGQIITMSGRPPVEAAASESADGEQQQLQLPLQQPESAHQNETTAATAAAQVVVGTASPNTSTPKAASISNTGSSSSSSSSSSSNNETAKASHTLTPSLPDTVTDNNNNHGMAAAAAAATATLAFYASNTVANNTAAHNYSTAVVAGVVQSALEEQPQQQLPTGIIIGTAKQTSNFVPDRVVLNDTAAVPNMESLHGTKNAAATVDAVLPEHAPPLTAATVVVVDALRAQLSDLQLTTATAATAAAAFTTTGSSTSSSSRSSSTITNEPKQMNKSVVVDQILKDHSPDNPSPGSSSNTTTSSSSTRQEAAIAAAAAAPNCPGGGDGGPLVVPNSQPLDTMATTYITANAPERQAAALSPLPTPLPPRTTMATTSSPTTTTSTTTRRPSKVSDLVVATQQIWPSPNRVHYLRSPKSQVLHHSVTALSTSESKRADGDNATEHGINALASENVPLLPLLLLPQVVDSTLVPRSSSSSRPLVAAEPTTTSVAHPSASDTIADPQGGRESLSKSQASMDKNPIVGTAVSSQVENFDHDNVTQPKECAIPPSVDQKRVPFASASSPTNTNPPPPVQSVLQNTALSTVTRQSTSLQTPEGDTQAVGGSGLDRPRTSQDLPLKNPHVPQDGDKRIAPTPPAQTDQALVARKPPLMVLPSEATTVPINVSDKGNDGELSSLQDATDQGRPTDMTPRVSARPVAETGRPEDRSAPADVNTDSSVKTSPSAFQSQASMVKGKDTDKSADGGLVDRSGQGQRASAQIPSREATTRGVSALAASGKDQLDSGKELQRATYETPTATSPSQASLASSTQIDVAGKTDQGKQAQLPAKSQGAIEHMRATDKTQDVGAIDKGNLPDCTSQTQSKEQDIQQRGNNARHTLQFIRYASCEASIPPATTPIEATTQQTSTPPAPPPIQGASLQEVVAANPNSAATPTTLQQSSVATKQQSSIAAQTPPVPLQATKHQATVAMKQQPSTASNAPPVATPVQIAKQQTVMTTEPQPSIQARHPPTTIQGTTQQATSAPKEHSSKALSIQSAKQHTSIPTEQPSSTAARPPPAAMSIQLPKQHTTVLTKQPAWTAARPPPAAMSIQSTKQQTAVPTTQPLPATMSIQSTKHQTILPAKQHASTTAIPSPAAMSIQSTKQQANVSTKQPPSAAMSIQSTKQPTVPTKQHTSTAQKPPSGALSIQSTKQQTTIPLKQHTPPPAIMPIQSTKQQTTVQPKQLTSTTAKPIPMHAVRQQATIAAQPPVATTAIPLPKPSVSISTKSPAQVVPMSQIGPSAAHRHVAPTTTDEKRGSPNDKGRVVNNSRESSTLSYADANLPGTSKPLSVLEAEILQTNEAPKKQTVSSTIPPPPAQAPKQQALKQPETAKLTQALTRDEPIAKKPLPVALPNCQGGASTLENDATNKVADGEMALLGQMPPVGGTQDLGALSANGSSTVSSLGERTVPQKRKDPAEPPAAAIKPKRAKSERAAALTLTQLQSKPLTVAQLQPKARNADPSALAVPIRSLPLHFNEATVGALSRWIAGGGNRKRPASAVWSRTTVEQRYRLCSGCVMYGHYDGNCATNPQSLRPLSEVGLEDNKKYDVSIEMCSGYIIEQRSEPEAHDEESKDIGERTTEINDTVKIDDFNIKASADRSQRFAAENETESTKHSKIGVGSLVAWKLGNRNGANAAAHGVICTGVVTKVESEQVVVKVLRSIETGSGSLSIDGTVRPPVDSLALIPNDDSLHLVTETSSVLSRDFAATKLPKIQARLRSYTQKFKTRKRLQNPEVFSRQARSSRKPIAQDST